MKKYSVALFLLAPLLAFDETPQTVHNLTVHEWGTLTSVAGQDGLPVD